MEKGEKTEKGKNKEEERREKGRKKEGREKKGREKENKLAENRENIRKFNKICPFYMLVFRKKFATIW